MNKSRHKGMEGNNADRLDVSQFGTLTFYMQTNKTVNMRREKVNQHRIKNKVLAQKKLPHSFAGVSTEFKRLFLNTHQTR